MAFLIFFDLFPSRALLKFCPEINAEALPFYHKVNKFVYHIGGRLRCDDRLSRKRFAYEELKGEHLRRFALLATVLTFGGGFQCGKRLIFQRFFSNDRCWVSDRRSLKSSTARASNETTWSIPNPNLHQRHYILENLYSFMDVILSSKGVSSSNMDQNSHQHQSSGMHAAQNRQGSAPPTRWLSRFSGKVPMMGSMTSNVRWNLTYIQEDSARI